MPDFYEKMKNRLRTAAEGADTVVWLAVSEAARKQNSGQFYQDRAAVSEYLPLSCTKAKDEDENRLMEILDEMGKKFSK